MRIIVFFFCLLSLQILAQTKIEKEVRVKENEVPEKALESIQENVKSKTKVKWYFQQDDEKEVYEAKFKQFGKQFSVEFLPSGRIYNVEIVINKRNIKKPIYQSIVSEIDRLFEDFSIVKIQKEYLGDADDLDDIIEDNEVDDDLDQRFEIEVNGKIDNNRHLYELIFDGSGKLLKQRKIKLKSTDILDY